MPGESILFCVERQKRQIQYQRNPVAIDQKEDGEEGVNGGFRDDVGVESIAEVDGVNVVTVFHASISYRT